MFFSPSSPLRGHRLTRSIPVLGLCLLVAGCAAFDRRSQDPWLARDKALHFFAGAAIGAVGARVAHSSNVSHCAAASTGIGLAFSIGLGKEWQDTRSPTGTPSTRDLLATIAGGIIGAQLVGECGR